MNDSTASPTRTGGCFCGAIKFVTTGAPLNVRACHCRDCQQFTGSAFFVRALFPRDHVTITGEPREYPSTDDVIRKFCPRCGSKLFAARQSRPDTLGISLSAFDHCEDLIPTEHIWVCDKQKWLSLSPDMKQHSQYAP
jgi:hypothetical protein